jgi:hypothetical protein
MDKIKIFTEIMNARKLSLPSLSYYRELCFFILISFLCTVNAQTNFKPILGDYDAEPRIGDHVNTDFLIQRLNDLGANTYMWLIYQNVNDWDDLQVFLPKAKIAGISVWVYLVPPSETPASGNQKFTKYSEPYRLDFIKWAEEIAKLSLRYSNLKGYVIDDFWNNTPSSEDTYQLFTNSYIDSFVTTGKTINPNIKFYALMYPQQPVFDSNDQLNTLSMDSLFNPKRIDGVVLAYSQDSVHIEREIDFFNDSFVGVVVSHPMGTRSTKGDYGFAHQIVTITDPDSESITIQHFDSQEGVTPGYHILQLRVDGRVVWSKDVSGYHDSTETIDLTNYIHNQTTSEIQLGIFNSSIVYNFYIDVWFKIVSVHGISYSPSKWTTSVKGLYAVRIKNNDQKFSIPLILMPAGEEEQYSIRYSNQATPENIAVCINMMGKFITKYQIEGIIIYALDKSKGSTTFEPIREVFSKIKRQLRL